MLDLNKIEKEAIQEIEKVSSTNEVEVLRVKYLGRKQGLITELFKELPKLSLEEKREFAPKLNRLKKNLEKLLIQKEKLSSRHSPKEGKLSQYFDPSLPGEKPPVGHAHPALLVIDEIKDIFRYLGFSWVDGPEVETDEYNFQKLRLHPDHPARDTQQTYYVGENLLRTHTSSMQVRYLENHKPPVRVLFPGRVYRREAIDATHLPGFLQLEGLLVDTEAKMTDLIGILDYFAKRLFGEKTQTRVYGHHFPYTEPSIEVEVLYKGKKWLEILGAGMVHPEVIKNAGLDPKKYRGWAFGMGPERIAMLKYGIEDIRLFYSSDLRFLRQF